MIRDINDKFKVPKKLSAFKDQKWKDGPSTSDDEAADFKENDIDEKPIEICAGANSANNAGLHRSFVPQNFLGRMLPTTPGFGAKKSMSYLKSIATPMQSRRTFKPNKPGLDEKKNGSYFQRLAAPVPEEGKKAESKTNPPMPRITITEASPADVSQLMMRTMYNAMNELGREPPNPVIPEVSNSSGTEGHFDTAMSHQSASISVGEGASERKDTPEFGVNDSKLGSIESLQRNGRKIGPALPMMSVTPKKVADSTRRKLRDET